MKDYIYYHQNQSMSKDLSTLDNDQSIIESELCPVCQTNQKCFFFECLNGSCNECLLEYLKTEVTKFKTMRYTKEIKFKCMFKCQCIISESTLIKIINNDHELKEEYYNMLFLIYISNNNEMINCPNNNCSNISFLKEKDKINNAATNNNSCVYTCSQCNIKFRLNNSCNINHINETDYFLDFKNLIFDYIEFKSYIKKLISAKLCRKCDTFIEKIDGCKHITCNRCGYSFCFQCSENWANHKEKYCHGINCNEYQETMNFNYGYFFIIYIGLITIIRLMYQFPYIIAFMGFIYRVFILILYIGIDFALIWMFFIQLLKMRNVKKSVFLCIFFGIIQLIELGLLSIPFSLLNCIVIKKFSWICITILGIIRRKLIV